MKLLPKHQDTVLGTYLDYVSRVNHFKENIQPYLFTFDAWERKEHEQVHSSNLNKVKECISYMMDNESIFNDLLSTYNITVVTFVARNPIK